MGVVYKLTDKIESFILAQKKEKPELSCRSLVQIVKQKFQIDLSKSAINTIIKEAGLSARVGRRGKQTEPAAIKTEPKTEPKISIPEQPKELEKLPVILKIEEEKPAISEEKKPAASPEIKPEIPKITPLLPLQSAMPILPQPVAKQEFKIEEPIEEPIIAESKAPQLIEIKEDEVIDNLGFYFLKVSEWLTSQQPILADIFRPYFPAYGLEELALKSELLLYLAGLGFKEGKDLQTFDTKGLWVINEAKAKFDLSALREFIDRLEAIRGLALAFVGGANQAFSEACYFKLILADNSVIYIDAQFHSLWPDSNTPAAMCSSLYKSSIYVNEFFKNNVQSAVFFTAPGYFNFSTAFYNFIYACEDMVEKRMLRLTLHNGQKNEISSPLRLAGQKRFFVFGFWPWQQEGNRFIQEDIRIVKSFFCADFGKEIFYSEMKLDLPQYQSFQGVRVRVALIRDAGLSWPRIGILTNLPDEKPIEEVISAYLRRWPNLDEGYQDFLRKSEQPGYSASRTAASPAPSPGSPENSIYTLGSAKVGLWQNLDYLISNLNSFCQRRFFPAEYANLDFPTMKQRFFSLPGTLKRQGNSLFLSLIPPAGYAFQKELIYAARRVNENDCTNRQGLKIWFKIR